MIRERCWLLASAGCDGVLLNVKLNCTYYEYPTVEDNITLSDREGPRDRANSAGCFSGTVLWRGVQRSILRRRLAREILLRSLYAQHAAVTALPAMQYAPFQPREGAN